VDEITGIEVDDSAASLPVLSETPQSPEMCTPVASTSTSGFGFFDSSSSSPRANVLLETVGVIQLHFFLPPHLLFLLHPAHITAYKFLTVRIPRTSWYSSPLQLTRVDIFRALCREISSASVGNEALDDSLIYQVIRTLRRRFLEELRGLMEGVACRSVDIPYREVESGRVDDYEGKGGVNTVDQVQSRRSRRLYCYDPHEHELSDFGYSGPQTGDRRAKQDDINANQGGALILYQQDPDGYQLGLAVWEPEEISLVPSYTVLFHISRSYSPFARARIPPPLSPHRRGFDMRPSVVDEMTLEQAIEAAQQCLSQDYPL
jgi:hypothetical protein